MKKFSKVISQMLDVLEDHAEKNFDKFSQQERMMTGDLKALLMVKYSEAKIKEKKAKKK